MRSALRLAAVALACALGAASVASGEIYRWRDERGHLHFTERIDKVPPRHRAAARANPIRVSGPSAVQTFSSPTPPASRPASRARTSRLDGEVEVPFVRQGTLMRVDVVLNEHVEAPFLVDTGASGISLPPEVADQLGIRVTGETPRVRVTTAAGIVSRPVVRLDSVAIGGARVENLYATVNPSMQIGLLGGTYFNNFVYRVDAAKSVITLSPNEGMRGGLGEEQWRERFNRIREPLARLTEHLEADEVQRKGERALLERRRRELLAELDALEDEANRLDVPYTWRR